MCNGWATAEERFDPVYEIKRVGQGDCVQPGFQLLARLERRWDHPDGLRPPCGFGRCATANEQFRTAAAHAAATGKLDMELMLHGYEALAGLLADPAAEAARRDFDSRVDALRAGGSDDGRFYAGQLSTARDVFTGRVAQSADRP